MSRVFVTEQIEDIVTKGNFSDSDIFRNFDEDGRQLYTIWNFGKATERLSHRRENRRANNYPKLE